MTMKRTMMMLVLVMAVAAITVPLIGVRAGGTVGTAPRVVGTPKAALPPSARVGKPQQVAAETGVQEEATQNATGKINPDVLAALGIKRVPKGRVKDVKAAITKRITGGNPAAVNASLPPGTGPGGSAPINPPATPKAGGQGTPLIGQPLVLNETSALSAALITTIGGRDNQFSEVALIADWDGREDCAADRGSKIDDFSFVEPDIDFSLTRAAISEVTFGNGHLLNLYYYGDSIGNVHFGADIVGSPLVDVIFDVNIPELVSTGTSGGFVLANPTAGDCTDDQVTVTGIAVNPVADLGDFDPALCGITGEVIYVSVFDAQGCASNAANQPIRTRIFEFATFNIGGTVFIVTNVRQILRSRFANIAGLTVDDDGSLYYQLLDLIQFTGGAIFKATEICRNVGNCTHPGRRVEEGREIHESTE